jgi:hypothetical protein
MKRVLFFSRNDLVNLYGGISQYLAESTEIIHLAYSSREEQILKVTYNIKEVIVFQDEIARLIKEEKLDLALILKIDQLIIEQTDNRFCLNSCIQSDRTFVNMPYEEILLLIQSYYRFWNKLIADKAFQYLFHEPVALFFLQIASVLCKKNESTYLTQIQVFGENKYNWIFATADNGFAIEMPESLARTKILTIDNQIRVDAFLHVFRKDFNLIIPQIASKSNKPGKSHPFNFCYNLIKTVFKSLFHILTFPKQSNFAPEEQIERYLATNIPRLSDRLKNQWDEYFYLHYDEFDPDKEFYYYPMHMEPEAVVLYWGEGIYKNQVKLIENIAGQLPPSCFLFVKVHPIIKEERNYLDYKRIKAIPNVKLIGPAISGKLIISKCKGLLTINGTSGFEAILMNKPVYVFGNSFYDLSNRVFKIKNIRELRETLYINHSKTYQDDEDLFHFIFSFLEIAHSGFTAYYSNYKEILKIDHSKNVSEVAAGMKKFLSSL